jgi:hypothetical protein
VGGLDSAVEFFLRGGGDEATYRALPAASLVAESVLWPRGARRWSHLCPHGLST